MSAKMEWHLLSSRFVTCKSNQNDSIRTIKLDNWSLVQYWKFRKLWNSRWVCKSRRKRKNNRMSKTWSKRWTLTITRSPWKNYALDSRRASSTVWPKLWRRHTWKEMVWTSWHLRRRWVEFRFSMKLCGHHVSNPSHTLSVRTRHPNGSSSVSSYSAVSPCCSGLARFCASLPTRSRRSPVAIQRLTISIWALCWPL